MIEAPANERFEEPKVSFRRFRARSRHPGHGDDRRSSAELRIQIAALARLGPLGVGRLVSVDSGTRLMSVNSRSSYAIPITSVESQRCWWRTLHRSRGSGVVMSSVASRAQNGIVSRQSR